jgi:hypothetical protein
MQVTARDTYMLAYSLACLKVQPSPAWQRILMGAARLRMGEASPMQLANLVWALAVMHARPSTQWLLELWRALSAAQKELGSAEAKQVDMQGDCGGGCVGWGLFAILVYWLL